MNKFCFFLSENHTYGLFESFAKELIKLNKEVIIIDLSRYLGTSTFSNDFYERISKIGAKLEIIQPVSSRSSVEDFNIAKDILEKISPEAIVVPYEFHFYFKLVQLAKPLRIKSFHIQHGLWGKGKFLKDYNRSEVTKYSFKKTLKLKLKLLLCKIKGKEYLFEGVSLKEQYLQSKGLYFPCFSDYFIAPTEEYAQQVRGEVNYHTGPITICAGFLRNDILSEDNENLHDRYNIPKNKKIVSYFFSPFFRLPDRFSEKFNSEEAMFNFFEIMASNIDDVYFLVFIHPSTKDYLKIAETKLHKKFSNLTITLTDNNQGSIYKNSFVVAGSKSGALTEANNFCKNVIRQAYVLGEGFEEFQKDFENVCYLSTHHDEARNIMNFINRKCVEKEKKTIGKTAAQNLIDQLQDMRLI